MKTLVTALLLFVAASAAAVAQSGDLQNGDFLVGVTVNQSFDGVEGRIVRFFGAVDNPPTFNEVAAGKGLAIFAAGYPVSRQISCNTSAITDQIEETITTISSFLAYKSDTNLYTYAWKTGAVWAGTCRS